MENLTAIQGLVTVVSGLNNRGIVPTFLHVVGESNGLLILEAGFQNFGLLQEEVIRSNLKVAMVTVVGSSDQKFEIARQTLAHLEKRIAAGCIACDLITFELTRDQILPEFSIRDFGSILLPGKHRKQRAFAFVSQTGSKFPGFPFQLVPSRTNPFFGREEEFMLFQEVLGQSRVTTITGLPGVGKSAFLRQAIFRLDSLSGSTVLFVDMSSVEAEPHEFASEIHRLYERQIDPKMTIFGSLVQWLSESQTVLAIDKLVDPKQEFVKFIQRIVGECPDLCLIATCPRPLGVSGEVNFRLEPLSCDFDISDPAETLYEYAAVKLIVERAETLHPSIPMTPEDLPFIAGIAQRLDGLPLALELAAHKLAVFDPKSLYHRLQDEIGLLDSANSPSTKQNSLTVALSTVLVGLSEKDLKCLATLTCFEGERTFEELEHLKQFWTDENDLIWWSCVEKLIDLSLVEVAKTNLDSRLFSTKRLIRSFVNSQSFALSLEGRFEVLETWVETTFSAWTDQNIVLVDLLPMVRRARADIGQLMFLYAENSGKHEALYKVCHRFSYFATDSEESSRELQFMHRLLERLPEKYLEVRGRLYTMMAWRAFQLKDLSQARTLSVRAILNGRRAGHKVTVATSTGMLGMIAGLMKKPEMSVRFFSSAAKSLRALGDSQREFLTLMNALASLGTREYELVPRWIPDRLVEILPSQADPTIRGRSLHNLLHYFCFVGDLALAKQCLLESWNLRTYFEEAIFQGNFLGGVTHYLMAIGEFELAAKCFGVRRIREAKLLEVFETNDVDPYLEEHLKIILGLPRVRRLMSDGFAQVEETFLQSIHKKITGN